MGRAFPAFRELRSPTRSSKRYLFSTRCHETTPKGDAGMATCPTQTREPRPSAGKPPHSAYPLLLQLGFLLTILAPLGLTLYAAFALTHGQVGWGYPVTALVIASITNLGTTAGYHRML